MSRTFGLVTKAIASESCCCSPPDRLPAICAARSPQDREEVEHLLGGEPSTARLVATDLPARQPQVLGDGQRREDAAAAGHHREPSAATSCVASLRRSAVELDGPSTSAISR